MTWADLEPLLLRDGVGEDAPHVLGHLRGVVTATDSATRRDALDAAIAALGTDGHAGRLLRLLASNPRPAPRELALELVARLRILEPALAAELRPLLRDRRIPTKVRLAAAVSLVHSATPTEANLVLRDFANGFGQGRFLERRDALRKRFKDHRRLFDRFAFRLSIRVPLACPHCGVKLSREAMARHLWDRHHRLLTGRRVRSPWRLIDHWAAAPGGSTENAYRQLLRTVPEDDDAMTELRHVVADRGSSLCPHCFAAVVLNFATFPAATDVAALNLSHGRLSGHGFIVELTDSLRGPHLRIETPTGGLFNGPEPNPPSGVSVRRLAVVGTVIIAVIFAGTLAATWALPLTLLTLLAALWLTIRLRAGEPDDRPGRIVNHAWRELAPHLHADGFNPVDADFLAALATISHRRGDELARDRTLKRAIAVTQAALVNRSAKPTQLIAIQRLRIADAEAIGGDPVAMLADAVRPCLDGELSPAAADLLLTDDLFVGWTRGQRARLRVLLVARAFAAGLGVWDLHALGRAAPGLGRVLHADDTDGLARLRLLWDLRPTRPWQQCGPAATVFELAKYPMLGGQHLETAPDLLLFQPLPAGGEPVHLLACGRGLVVGGELIHDWPTPISSRPLPGSKGGGYELRFGSHALQVRGNVEDLVPKLEAWGTYFFEEFLPWIGNALSRSEDDAHEPLGSLTVTCPECGKPFVGRRGDLGRPSLAKSSRPTGPGSA
jgi:predicted RNA-binding Zn-ribbon protein involved in translation (DUF1610 family)